MAVLRAVEQHLRAAGLSPSAFGRLLGDPGLVFDLRRGREPRAPLVRRIEAAIAAGTRRRSGPDAR